MELSKVEDILGYDYSNPKLLEIALTHSSFSHENGGGDYEYLEFVGDSILGFVVSEYLYKHVPESVGTLSRLKASLVSTDNLYDIMQSMGLSKYIRLGKSLKVANSKKLYADVFEAIVASMYFDGGMMLARAFIEDSVIIDEDNISIHLSNCVDFKTQLQEFVQGSKDKVKLSIRYDVTSTPDGFEATCIIGDRVLSKAGGRTKKSAEQLCARAALNILKSEQ